MSTPALPPIDGNALSAYREGGRRHFDSVRRSRDVLVRNALELMSHLEEAQSTPAHAVALLGAGPPVNMVESGKQAFIDQAEAYRKEFWSVLDQRLHNLVASAVSLVDQTRLLVKFYVHEPEFQAEFDRRNSIVRDNLRSQFVRRLRNYLLHAGVAPVMQTMHLGGGGAGVGGMRLEIKLSSTGLLRWSGFESGARQYIEEHKDGLPLRQIFGEYVTDMVEINDWLLRQHVMLHDPMQPPRHLSEGRANKIVYGSMPEDADY